jgi:hypothetical protein
MHKIEHYKRRFQLLNKLTELEPLEKDTANRKNRKGYNKR